MVQFCYRLFELVTTASFDCSKIQNTKLRIELSTFFWTMEIMPIFFWGYRTFSHAAPAERLWTVSSPFISFIQYTAQKYVSQTNKQKNLVQDREYAHENKIQRFYLCSKSNNSLIKKVTQNKVSNYSEMLNTTATKLFLDHSRQVYFQKGLIVKHINVCKTLHKQNRMWN